MSVHIFPDTSLFQFTHPGRGATQQTDNRSLREMFQFTHPGRGATFTFGLSFCTWCSFNSRTPGGVRRPRR